MQLLLETEQQLSEFALSWRFMDESYHQWPSTDLQKIWPGSAQEALTWWRQYVSKTYDHVMQLTHFTNEINRFRVDWEDDYQGRQLLTQQCPFPADSLILFFWSPQVAVKTHWGLFTQHWTDFCYPDDDNNVIIALPFKLYFCEELFIVEQDSRASTSKWLL
ncbi:MAG: DUF2947 family protein [Thioploca sp.]|nr:DUF2947 family protein [Thioploca sp.]